MVHRYDFSERVTVSFRNVVHLILIIGVQTAICCKVLRILKYYYSPFKPQKVTVVQGQIERGFIFNLPVTVAFKMIPDIAALEEV